MLLLDEDKEVIVKTDKGLRIGEVYLLKVKGEEVVEVKESSKAKVSYWRISKGWTRYKDR